MSSRIAVCGQPPVSTAPIRSAGERLVAHEELGVLLREDVVGHDREVVVVAEQPAEREQQRRLAAADRAADADGERALRDSRARSGASRSCEEARAVRLVVGRGRRCVMMRMRTRMSAWSRAASSRSRLKQPRVQPIVRRLQQVDDRRGLREVVERRARRSARATSSSRGPHAMLQPLRLEAARRAQPHRRGQHARARRAKARPSARSPAAAPSARERRARRAARRARRSSRRARSQRGRARPTARRAQHVAEQRGPACGWRGWRRR